MQVHAFPQCFPASLLTIITKLPPAISSFAQPSTGDRQCTTPHEAALEVEQQSSAGRRSKNPRTASSILETRSPLQLADGKMAATSIGTTKIHPLLPLLMKGGKSLGGSKKLRRLRSMLSLGVRLRPQAGMQR